jgi:hypothetical protein
VLFTPWTAADELTAAAHSLEFRYTLAPRAGIPSRALRPLFLPLRAYLFTKPLSPWLQQTCLTEAIMSMWERKREPQCYPTRFFLSVATMRKNRVWSNLDDRDLSTIATA